MTSIGRRLSIDQINTRILSVLNALEQEPMTMNELRDRTRIPRNDGSSADLMHLLPRLLQQRAITMSVRGNVRTGATMVYSIFESA